MKAEIAYVGHKKLIDINSIVDVNSRDNSEFRDVLGSLLRKKIIDNGFFHSIVKILEDKDHKITNVLVDNCVSVKINNIRIVNINLNSKINLDTVSRDINYEYKDKQINSDIIKNILDDIYNRVIKLCLLVKDIHIIVELNKRKNNEVNLLCVLDLVDASTNYLLDVKLNTDFFAKNTKEDIANIYDKFIFDTDNLSLYNLKDALSKYINQHSYIKNIVIYCSEKNEKQIMDFIVYVSLLSNLTIKSMTFFDFKYNKDIINAQNLFIIDGNLVNKLYFRVFVQPFGYYNGLYIRFKKQMGYKRLFYVGLNYYLHELNSMSDINFILKLKQQINNKSLLIGRLSLRYLFKLNNVNIGFIIGHKTNSLDIRILILELLFIKLLRTGINVYYHLNSGLLNSLNIFVGMSTLSSFPQDCNISSIVFRSVPTIHLDLNLSNILVSIKMIIDDLSDVHNRLTYDSSVYYVFKYSYHIFRIGLSVLKDINGIRYRPALSLNII